MGVTIVRPPANNFGIKFRKVTDQIIVNAFNSVVGNTAYVEDGSLKFTNLPTGHQAGDLYYFTFTQAASANTNPVANSIIVNGYTGINNIEGYTQTEEAKPLNEAAGTGFDSAEMVDRKIKISMEHTDAGVKSWAEGISYNVGDIVYSDGHYYECMAGGTSGQTQPTHTTGTYSDGKVTWKYLHSGYGYITITSVESSTSMTGHVDSLLPYTSGSSSDAHDWNSYQWSMWGYKGRYPNQVFMFNGRLGYTLDTAGYGSWLQLSKSDEFDDFSVEEFGEVVDTCAVNTLISEYNENRINWVISGYRLYMGSYAGEYNVSGGSDNKSVITPSNCNTVPVSQAGGGPVKAVKFEDLNLFASGDRHQLFSLKYDYTSDDYIPSDIGFAGEDLLDSGIVSMWHLRGYDRNLYLRTENNKIVVINQPEDVKALGFFRVDMCGDVLDHCVSNANGESTQFVMVKRGDNYMVEFVEPDYQPYMLGVKDYVSTEDTGDILVGVGTQAGALTADGQFTTEGLCDFKRVSDDSVVQQPKVDTYLTTDFVRVKGGTAYIMNDAVNHDYYHTSIRVHAYDANRYFIGPVLNDIGVLKSEAIDGYRRQFTLTMPENAVYVRVQYFNQDTPSLQGTIVNVVADTITDVDFAGQAVYVYDNNTGAFERQEVGNLGVINNPYTTDHLIVGIEMPCEIHTHPLYNDKLETLQQKSVRYTIRVVNSGAFSYGSSNQFNKWYDYDNWNTTGSEEYTTAHNLMTGDIHLPSSFGYQQAQNKADSKYPNDSSVALNLKAVTPEPFNLLLVSSIYV